MNSPCIVVEMKRIITVSLWSILALEVGKGGLGYAALGSIPAGSESGSNVAVIIVEYI